MTGSYRYEWSLFVDWCTAAQENPLPASPIALAEFLDGNPAGDAVQVRRVSAINRRHVDAGHIPPGRVTSIRLALNSVRADRIARRGTQLRVHASELPIVGGTEALFGRRDAVLLLLAGAGISYAAISDLNRHDVTTDGGDLWIGGTHRIRIPADLMAGDTPTQVWERWRSVLQFSDRYLSASLLDGHLRRGSFPDMEEWPDHDGPVAVPIDRWGHMPFPVAPMSAVAVAAVVGAYRSGVLPRRASRPFLRVGDEPRDTHVETVGKQADSTELDSGYYEVGIAARRRAHDDLKDVSDLVDDVEDRIEQLLLRTLAILGDSGGTET